MRVAVRDQFLHSDRTLQEIADHLGGTYKVVWKIVREEFTDEERQVRKRKNYRRSKLGPLNPMTGKTGEQHPNFKGSCDDGYGYKIVLKPSWYTGRPNSKHVFEHHVVVCEALGITEIPIGWDVHHVNKDRSDNRIENLALCTKAAHQQIHVRMQRS